MIAPIVFASFLFFLLITPMLKLLGIPWHFALLIAALLSAGVGYSALSTTGVI